MALHAGADLGIEAGRGANGRKSQAQMLPIPGRHMCGTPQKIGEIGAQAACKRVVGGSTTFSRQSSMLRNSLGAGRGCNGGRGNGHGKAQHHDGSDMICAHPHEARHVCRVHWCFLVKRNDLVPGFSAAGEDRGAGGGGQFLLNPVFSQLSHEEQELPLATTPASLGGHMHDLEGS